MRKHSNERKYGCPVCRCGGRFKHEKDQKRHSNKRCKHRRCTKGKCQVQPRCRHKRCTKGNCQLQPSGSQTPPNTPSTRNTPNTQYSPSTLSYQTGPRPQVPQSPPYPQQQSPGLRYATGGTVQFAQGGWAPPSVPLPVIGQDVVWFAQQLEGEEARQVFYNRARQNEVSINNDVLESIGQDSGDEQQPLVEGPGDEIDWLLSLPRARTGSLQPDNWMMR